MDQHFQQSVGHDAVQCDQITARRAAAQQFQGFHRAVVGQEVVVAVVAPVQFGAALDQLANLFGVQFQGHRGQPAQLHLGVFVDHLAQRQNEQPRGVDAGEAVPAGELHVIDEGAEGQHQVVVQIQSTSGAGLAAGRADHQAQHAMAPAADPGVVGFGEQVVDLVDTRRVKAQQGRAAELAAGVKEGIARRTVSRLRCPAEVLAEVAVQGWAAAGVAGVEQEVFEVHRDEFQRAGQLVGVGTARQLRVVLFAQAAFANPLRPAGQIEQARVIAEGEAAVGLPAAVVRQADLPEIAGALTAMTLQQVLIRRPQARAIVQMRHFMNDGGEQLAACRAVGSIGLFLGSAAVGERRQQATVEFQALAAGAAIGLFRQVVAPLHAHLAIEALHQARGQGGHGFVQQRLAGGALFGVQRA